MPENVLPSIRYLLYLLVFAIPFETSVTETVAIIGSVPMILGMVLTGAALLQPRICFAPPPGAFWCFVGYLILCLVLGTTQNLDYISLMLQRLIKLAQMLVLMWISFNLFRYPDICRNAILTFVAACATLAALQIVGVGAVSIAQGRTSMFGDNANVVGSTLSLGLIMLVGMTYAQTTVEKRLTFLVWIVFSIMGTAIVMTGSRGALIGLVVGIALLILRDGTWQAKLKMGSIAVLAIGFLVFTALSDDAMRTRLERSFYQGDTAGRDRIQGHAWVMFFEKPILGWGPLYNEVELGSRLGRSIRATHSLYLAVLTETGLVGFILFFGGVGLLVRAAWQARLRTQGALPMALMGSILISAFASQWTGRKLFWVIIAYVLASAWPLRETARQAPIQFSDPINVGDQGAGAVASLSEPINTRSGNVSARREGTV